MKIVLIFLLCFVTAYSQNQTGLKKAVFKDCLSKSQPITCTSNKFELGLQELFTPQVNYYVYEKAGSYFGLTYAIVIDINGKIIPDDIYVDCEVLALKTSVIDYFKNLPEFSVPDDVKKQPDSRSLYFNNLVFIFDEKLSTFVIAEEPKATALNIKFNPYKCGTQPILKDCKGVDDESGCTTQNVQKIVAKKFKVPKLSAGVYKFSISFVVGRDGKLEEITTDDSRFEKEVLRVMKKIDDFLPGTIHGIPVRARYNLPMTIRVSE